MYMLIKKFPGKYHVKQDYELCTHVHVYLCIQQCTAYCIHVYTFLYSACTGTVHVYLIVDFHMVFLHVHTCTLYMYTICMYYTCAIKYMYMYIYSLNINFTIMDLIM